VPEEIAAIALQNKEVVYAILFHATAETLRTIAADPKHLGAEIGFFAVLHSWGQNLLFHPHLHCVVPGGGPSLDGDRWVYCRPDFFLPVRVLSRLFRRLFLESLRKAFDSGKLQFFGTLEPLHDRSAFTRHLALLKEREWVVYAKAPFAGPGQVLDYVGRYTLTSEDRWNELADVILANPPFMSPKGGIKPHKRFSIQAKRSEVLFVDYMAEHLTPSGRAGIIVPEGIIFQSQTAYRDLRKTLVETALVAVVSLPAGCFNPYSGVKTSILILDRSLARQGSTIAFFKVENDGFGLGAQRREITKNDLPQVKAELNSYLHALRSGQPTADLPPTSGLIVPKAKIAANDDYNLSGERYREGTATQHRFPQVELGTICKPEYGFTASAEDKGDARFVRITDIAPNGRIRKEEPKFIRLTHESEPYLLKKGDLLVARTGATFGKTMLFDEDYPAVFASYLIRLRFPRERLLPEFYWSFAQSEKYWEQARNLATGGGQPQFNGNALTEVKIPLPPLEVQKEIVAEIEGYQKVINGARAVLDNYRPHIPVNPDWPNVKLSEIFSFKNGLNFNKDSSTHTVKIIGVSDFQTNLYAPLAELDEVKLNTQLSEDYLVKGGDILFVRSNGNPDLVGRSIIVPPTSEPTTFSGFTIRARIEDERALPMFCAHFFKSRDFAEMIKTVGRGANIRNLSQAILNELTIPLPPLATQQGIVAEIEAEQQLVGANRELIERLEKKIQATLARVWGEEEPATTEA